MEITCQASYPLNSENASPPGTFKVYLSWADMALAPMPLTSAVRMAIVRMRLLVTGSSFVQVGSPDFLRDGAWYQAHPSFVNGRPDRRAADEAPFPHLGSGSRASSRVGSGVGPRDCAHPRRRELNRGGSLRRGPARSH